MRTSISLLSAPLVPGVFITLIAASFLQFSPQASAQSPSTSREGSGKQAGQAKEGAPSKGRMVESGEGGFRIRLPREFPDFVTQTRVVSGRNQSFSAYLSIGSRGSFTVVPGPARPGLPATLERMKSARDYELKMTNTTIEREETLRVRGTESLEVYSKGPHLGLDRFIRFRFFAVGDRLFEVIYISLEKDSRDDQDITAAFESFEAMSEKEIKSIPQGPSKPLSFSSPDKAFSVVLPPGFQQPVDQSQVVQGRVPEFKVTQFLSSGSSGLILLTHFSEIPDLKTPDQIERFRDGVTEAMVSGFKGKIISSKPVERNGLAAVNIRFTGEAAGQGLLGRGLIFGRKGEVLCFLLLATTPEAVESEEMNRFFDSIKFTP